MDKEQIDAIKKAVMEDGEFTDEDNLRYTARFMVVGKKKRTSFATVCHAALNQQYAGHPEDRFAVVNGFQTDYNGMNGAGKWTDTSLEDKALYLDWLFNRSPYASTFISKSAIRSLNYGFSVSDCATPSNLMAAGLVATRRMWEYPYILRVWVDLTKAGVNENLAYYLAHLALCKVDGTGEMSWNSPAYGHCSIDSHLWGVDSVKNFINSAPQQLNQLYTKNINYYGYGRMFTEKVNEKDPLYKWINANFPYKEEKKEVDKNPFKAARVERENTISYKKGIKRMAAFATKIMEKVNA